MRCRHCGTRFNKSLTIPPFRASCPRCARIASPILVSEQGDGVTGFREIMIRQNANESGRKLLESPTHQFVIFLDAEAQVIGFDIEDQGPSHLFQWRKGKKPNFYGLTNIGKGYHNRDETYINGHFDSAEVLAELNQVGGNLRSEIRRVLLEGISAYRSMPNQPQGTKRDARDSA